VSRIKHVLQFVSECKKETDCVGEQINGKRNIFPKPTRGLEEPKLLKQSPRQSSGRKQVLVYSKIQKSILAGIL